jgi:hypothetical protein
MPDLQSELKKTLSAWEADAQQTQPDVKPKEQLNMTTQAAPAPKTLTPKKKEPQAKRIFDYITSNPGNTHMGYAKALVKHGIKSNSTSSLISQMIRNNIVNRDIEGKITPATTTYRSIKKLPAIQKHKPKRNLTLIVKKVAPDVGKQSEGIAAIATATTTSPRMVTTWDAKVMIDNLSVSQARALYDELTKIFRG